MVGSHVSPAQSHGAHTHATHHRRHCVELHEPYPIRTLIESQIARIKLRRFLDEDIVKQKIVHGMCHRDRVQAEMAEVSQAGLSDWASPFCHS